MAHATLALLTLFAATLCITSTSAAKVLVYPFGHCLNSHLLNAEKVSFVFVRYNDFMTITLRSQQ